MTPAERAIPADLIISIRCDFVWAEFEAIACTVIAQALHGVAYTLSSPRGLRRGVMLASMALSRHRDMLFTSRQELNTALAGASGGIER